MAFVYCWYGNPEHDGEYKHWNHEVLPHWQEHVSRQYPQIGRRFQPPQQLHSPYYPLRGPYSSADPEVLEDQFREMKRTGIGVAAVSWWGPVWRNGTHDTQGVSTDERLPTLLAAAERAGMAIAFHLEPYPGRTAATVREDLQYLMRRPEVAASPAVLRLGPQRRPLYFVYDSYHISPADWAALLTPGGEGSMRGSDGDGVFIGLWLNAGDGDAQLLPGGFDGFYTYFASEAVSFGADPANWPELAAWAWRHGRLFIPSVGPGYDDSRIRPWNAAATRPRQGGARYRHWWEAALAVQPAAVSITSYNEWGEGTQIEPAKVFPAGGGSSIGSRDADAGDGSSSSGSTGADGSSGNTGADDGSSRPGSSSVDGSQEQYQSYGEQPGRDEWLYLNITAEYARQLEQQQQQQQQQGERADAGRPHIEL
ncbi:hypothetical protein COHA_009063 [Chlorella ohadii]|uniref:Uncharacterized protein n=1 Tax=Chlorella ohadii TaxID=2649997 RepID=A0AAD5GYE0_9CHLO|nr:hypothetical protein COHA_009063 [Chlorella ohadii]